jgi:hypothetical protein
MSKHAKKKSFEAIHKYFKPLNEISDQTIPSPSAAIEPVRVDDIPTNNPSELSFPLTTSTLIDKISHLSVNSEKIILCNSFKNISTTNADSILLAKSNQSTVPLQSNIDIQSFDTAALDQSNGKNFFSELNRY